MPSYSIPLSGLDANSQALSIISNNLANLNTVGYKAEQPLFQDLLYQQLGTDGAGDPLQTGQGTSVGAISTLNTQGSLQNTGAPTDVAIQGGGFFVVSKGGQQFYTRDGSFTLDTNGILTTADGAQVQGYSAVKGVVSTNQALGSLAVPPGQINPPQASANMQLRMNLDASTAVNGQFQTSMTIYDTLGAAHVLTFQFTKTAANSWGYQITIPATDVGTTGSPVVVNSGTLSFDGSGNLTAPTANVTGINVTGYADGAANSSLTWQILGANGAPVITQVAGPSAVSATQQDGFSSGTLQSFTIGSDGTIQGTYSNGQTVAVGQVALASFANLQGLVRTGDNNFQATLSSGAPIVGVPGSGGRGTLDGGSLEQSNVDIAQEFANLIIAERGFEANSKALTTFDQVTQDALNLKATP